MASKAKAEKSGEVLEVLEINGKSYDLYIGFAFIREIDKRHQEEIGSASFGIGIGMLNWMLEQRNPIGLLDFIQCATITEKQKPSIADIEKQIDIWYSQGDDVLDGMYENFTKRLERSSMTGPTIKLYRQEANSMTDN
jgi:hypothetical protein